MSAINKALLLFRRTLPSIGLCFLGDHFFMRITIITSLYKGNLYEFNPKISINRLYTQKTYTKEVSRKHIINTLASRTYELLNIWQQITNKNRRAIHILHHATIHDIDLPLPLVILRHILITPSPPPP